MPATVLFLECKSYVIVGIYASISGFLLMCDDVWFSGSPGLAVRLGVRVVPSLFAPGPIRSPEKIGQ